MALDTALFLMAALVMATWHFTMIQPNPQTSTKLTLVICWAGMLIYLKPLLWGGD